MRAPTDSGPNVRVVEVCCVATWAATVLGVVVGIVLGEWLVVAWAANAAVCAAGWLLAARRWFVWRELAVSTLAAASFLLGGRPWDQDDEDDERPGPSV